MLRDSLLQDLLDRFKSINTIKNLATTYNISLLSYILQDSPYKAIYKERFFINLVDSNKKTNIHNTTHSNANNKEEHITNTLIFKQTDFITFCEVRLLESGYTKYSNKIGYKHK